MPTGDTLGFLGLIIAAMIGALTTSGWRSRFLWALTFVFALMTVAHLGVFAQFGISISGANQWVLPVIAPLTVGTVALMLRERRAPAPDETTVKAEAERRKRDQWEGALIQIESAISTADWEGYQLTPSAGAESLAVLASAFATIRKVYGVETPNLTSPNKPSLQVGVEYLRCIQCLNLQRRFVRGHFSQFLRREQNAAIPAIRGAIFAEKIQKLACFPTFARTFPRGPLSRAFISLP